MPEQTAPEAPPSAQGQEPAAETPLGEALDAAAVPEAVPPPEPPAVETPPPPQYTQEQLIEMATDRAFQKLSTTEGRRHAEFVKSVSDIIDNRFRAVQPAVQPPAEISDDPAAILANSREWLRQNLAKEVPTIISEMTQREQAKVNSFNNEIVRNIGQTITSDPLFSGEETDANKTIRKEILDEITANIAKVDRNIHPQIAARMVYSDSVSNVYRKAVGTKTNALAGNKPITGPIGNLKPSAPAQAKAKMPVLDDVAKSFKAAFKISDEEAAEMLRD
jgi:hypothetical protein